MGKLAYRRTLGMSGVMLLLASLLAVIGSPALADSTIFAKALIDHECDSTEWHFVINQVDSEANAPASITVSFSGGDVVEVPLDKFTGGVAHYATTQNLDEAVTSASTTIYDGWSGEFNLSHGPCNQVTTTSDDSTTTSDDVTTTSEDETTTTSEDETTTTSEDETTTTSEDETTTTTEDETTTTTAQQVITTRVDQTTASTAATTASTAGTTASTTGSLNEVTVSVGGIQVSAPAVAQVTQATLPFTGLSTTSIATLAAGLAAIGLLLLAAARRVDEEAPVRRW